MNSTLSLPTMIVRQYVDLNLSLMRIASIHQLGTKAVRRILVDANVEIRTPTFKKHDHIKTGCAIGNWCIIEKLPRRNGTVMFRCQCLLCARFYPVRRDHLANGASTRCKKCANKGDASHRWTGHAEITGSFWSSIRTGARKRHLIFEINIEAAWSLYLEQEKKCALTGLSIGFDDRTASLDRIDSNVGYQVGNIQWVHKHLNMMKNSLEQAQFISLCRLVTQNFENSTCSTD